MDRLSGTFAAPAPLSKRGSEMSGATQNAEGWYQSYIEAHKKWCKAETELARLRTERDEAVSLLRTAAFSRVADEHDMRLASEMNRNGWQ